MCGNCPAGIDRRKLITHQGCIGCPLNQTQPVPDDGYGQENPSDSLDEMELQVVGLLK